MKKIIFALLFVLLTDAQAKPLKVFQNGTVMKDVLPKMNAFLEKIEPSITLKEVNAPPLDLVFFPSSDSIKYHWQEVTFTLNTLKGQANSDKKNYDIASSCPIFVIKGWQIGPYYNNKNTNPFEKEMADKWGVYPNFVSDQKETDVVKKEKEWGEAWAKVPIIWFSVNSNVELDDSEFNKRQMQKLYDGLAAIANKKYDSWFNGYIQYGQTLDFKADELYEKNKKEFESLFDQIKKIADKVKKAKETEQEKKDIDNQLINDLHKQLELPPIPSKPVEKSLKPAEKSLEEQIKEFTELFPN